MEYKRLGNYIEPIDERNSELKIKLSQGINNNKYFQEPRQVAENSAADKIVRRGYFAYNRATTRNGEKISIAYREGPDCTVSSAYQVFKIKDEEKLNPIYLLMWFKRPDFDRYARFKSHGSAHEFFEFEEMCDVMLPIPSITRQREIVSEYETLTNRIHLNEQMIQKLEATAQALYRRMFVNGKDKENLPEGWRMGTLGEISKCISGYPFDGEAYSDDTGIIALRGENVTEQSLRWNIVKRYDGEITERINKCILNAWDIVIGMDGSKVGKNWSFVYNNNLPLLLAQRVACLRTRAIEKQVYIYLTLRMEKFSEYVSRVNTGSTILHISTTQIEDFPIPIPTLEQFNVIKEEWVPLYKHICLKNQENEKLTELQSLLLAKLG
jgi:type I restriction enzyme S subunit